jgi:hypothetical protein
MVDTTVEIGLQGGAWPPHPAAATFSAGEKGFAATFKFPLPGGERVG